MSKPTYEELVAQVEVLRTQITKAREYLSHVDVNSAGAMLDVALESTPAACLAAVRAGGVIGAVDEHKNNVMTFDFTDAIRVTDLIKYANRIQQGSKS